MHYRNNLFKGETDFMGIYWKLNNLEPVIYKEAIEKVVVILVNNTPVNYDEFTLFRSRRGFWRS